MDLLQTSYFFFPIVKFSLFFFFTCKKINKNMETKIDHELWGVSNDPYQSWVINYLLYSDLLGGEFII